MSLLCFPIERLRSQAEAPMLLPAPRLTRSDQWKTPHATACLKNSRITFVDKFSHHPLEENLEDDPTFKMPAQMGVPAEISSLV